MGLIKTAITAGALYGVANKASKTYERHEEMKYGDGSLYNSLPDSQSRGPRASSPASRGDFGAINPQELIGSFLGGGERGERSGNARNLISEFIGGGGRAQRQQEQWQREYRDMDEQNGYPLQYQQMERHQEWCNGKCGGRCC